MKQLIVSVFLTFALLCPCCCVVTGDLNDIETLEANENNKLKVVLRFYPQNDAQVDLLARQLPIITDERADFWTPPNYLLDPVDVMLPAELVPLVETFAKSNGFSGTKIVVKDVQK